MDSQNSLNSSYQSDVVHSKVGVFMLVDGRFNITNLRAAVGAARGSAAVPTGSIGWAMMYVCCRHGILTEVSHKVSEGPKQL